MADHGEICSGGFDPKNDPDDRRKLAVFVIIGILFIWLFVAFSSCTHRVYVPMERTTTRTVELRDTVIEIKLNQVHDTVTITTQGQDTTSYLKNEHSYSFAVLRDGKLGHSLGTLPGAVIKDSIKVEYVIIRDSIPYPVEVEKKLTRWQQSKMEYGGFAMGAAVALALILILFIRYHEAGRE